MGQRTLTIMRHAKSSWEVETSDELRELSARGRRDAAAAGKAAEQPYDLVVTSPAARARLTWEKMAAEGARAGEVTTDDRLYERDAEDVLQLIAELPDSATNVLLIGHSPTLVEVIGLVAERASSKAWYALDEKFPTSAQAVIDVDGPWASLPDKQGTLTDVRVPRG